MRKFLFFGIVLAFFQPLLLIAANKNKLKCTQFFMGFSGVATRVAPEVSATRAESFALPGLEPEAERPKSVKQVTAGNIWDISAQSSYSGPAGGGSERWIKFIAFRKPNGKYQIEFQDSISQRFHEEFLRTQKGYETMSREQMEKLALTGVDRPILFGTILTDKLTGADATKPPFPWKFELVTAESIPFKDVKHIHELLSANAKEVIKGPLKYKPVAGLRDEVRQNPAPYQQAGITIEFPKPAEGTIVYTPGWSIGVVKRVKAAELPALIAQDKILPADILVLDELPRELPPVAGVITGAESSPNSHVALLAQMRGTVFFYENGAYESKDWQRMESSGSSVLLQAFPMGVRKLEGLSATEATQLQQLKVRAPIGKIVVNRKELEIQPGELLQTKDIPAYGAKAVNYGLLRRLFGDKHTEASLGIPLGYFELFKTSKQTSGEKLGKRIETLLNGISDPSTPNSVVSKALAEVRSLIMDPKQIIPPKVLETIQAKLLAQFPNKKKVKLRSSSPIEDLREFNGAGLYDSFGAKTKDLASIEEGLRAVWASFYNDRAYFARREFSLDQTQGSMAVQVNPTFKGELANGVMIYGKDRYGQKSLIVTGFPGEDLEVTNPPVGKRPETSKVIKYEGMEPEVYLETPSTELPTERMLLDKSEYATLFEIGDTVEKAWKKHTGNSDANLDFEWKLILGEDGKRKVIVKQVREVPPPPVTQLQKLGDTLVLPSKKESLKTDLGENPDGMLGLIANQINLLPAVTSFKMNPDLTTRNPIAELVLRLPSGKELKISGTQLKSEFSQTPWKNESGSFGGTTIVSKEPSHQPEYVIIPEPWKKEVGSIGVTTNVSVEQSRQKEWTISLANPEVPSLRLKLGITERRASSTSAIETPLVLLGDLGMSLVVDPADLPMLKLRRPNNPRTEKIEWRVSIPEQELKYEKRTPYKVTAEFKGKVLTAAIEGTSEFGGYDKTFFADLVKTKISGLTSTPLELDKSTSMVHAAGHHNFTWSVAVDLFQAKNFNAVLKKEIEAKGGRYLLFEGGLPGFTDPSEPNTSNKLWLINEKGDWTDLGTFEGNFSNGTTPILGGG